MSLITEVRVWNDSWKLFEIYRISLFSFFFQSPRSGLQCLLGYFWLCLLPNNPYLVQRSSATEIGNDSWDFWCEITIILAWICKKSTPGHQSGVSTSIIMSNMTWNMHWTVLECYERNNVIFVLKLADDLLDETASTYLTK